MIMEIHCEKCGKSIGEMEVNCRDEAPLFCGQCEEEYQREQAQFEEAEAARLKETLRREHADDCDCYWCRTYK